MNLRRVDPDDFRQSGARVPVAVGQVVLEKERVSGGQAVCRILDREFELSLDQIADRFSLMSDLVNFFSTGFDAVNVALRLTLRSTRQFFPSAVTTRRSLLEVNHVRASEEYQLLPASRARQAKTK